MIQSIIKRAGERLRNLYSHTQNVSIKERYELVSHADLEIESLILRDLKEAFPEDGIFSEERGEVSGSSTRKWIVDPIDGTANFVFGAPHCGISIALERGGEIQMGMVYNPFSDELFYAEQERDGAFLNGERIEVSTNSQISQALIALGFSANPKKMQEYLDEWGSLMSSSRKSMPLITPSLTICNVAMGRIDGYLDSGSSYEGKAAAGLILMKAGGRMLGYDGGTNWSESKGHLALNSHLDINPYRNN